MIHADAVALPDQVPAIVQEHIIPALYGLGQAILADGCIWFASSSPPAAILSQLPIGDHCTVNAY